jgi:retron-type reverse transcriptase
LAAFLAELQEDLLTGRYEPQPNRKVDIPKDNGKVRMLQIPTPLSYYPSIQVI